MNRILNTFVALAVPIGLLTAFFCVFTDIGRTPPVSRCYRTPEQYAQDAKIASEACGHPEAFLGATAAQCFAGVMEILEEARFKGMTCGDAL